MNQLKAWREQRGLSQRQLAKRAGVAFRTVQLAERGRDCRRSTWLKLAGTLGVDEGALFEGETAMVTAQSAARAMTGTGGDAWKSWLFELVDEFRRAPRLQLVARAPDPEVEPRSLALLASTVEALCAQAGIPAPWWCDGVPGLPQPWFPAGAESLKASALVESPAAFRKRNIFVLGNFLSRA